MNKTICDFCGSEESGHYSSSQATPGYAVPMRLIKIETASAEGGFAVRELHACYMCDVRIRIGARQEEQNSEKFFIVDVAGNRKKQTAPWNPHGPFKVE